MESDYPRGTCENVVYHSHVTIQTILTSYLRPVYSFLKAKFADGVEDGWFCQPLTQHLLLILDTMLLTGIRELFV